MSRRIRMTFIDEQISVEAELLEDQAPQTCQAIWDGLPREGEGQHAIYSGSEIAFFMDHDLIIEPENQTSCVLPGDIGYYHLPPGLMHEWLDGINELCWFYGSDSRPNMPDGPVKINLFAKMVGDTSGFYAVCYRIRREGVKRVRVEQG